MARARKVQKQVKKEPVKRTKKKAIKKPKLIKKQVKAPKVRQPKPKVENQKQLRQYPRTYYTLKEDATIIERLQKRDKKESIHKVTKELEKELSRTYESLRDRIRRYLNKLGKEDQKLVMDVSKNNPSTHLTFEIDKKGNKSITKVQKSYTKKGKEKAVQIIKTKDDLDWLKKNLNSKDFYFAADHGSRLLACILFELQEEQNVPKEKVEQFVRNLNDHVDLEEVFRFFSIQLIQYFYRMSQQIIDNIQPDDLERYEKDLDILKVCFDNETYQNKFSIKKQIIFLTSGGTLVYLDKQKDYILDNFSTGSRGSKMVQYFLQNQYCVIFLSREKSLKPFSKEFDLKQKNEQEEYIKSFEPYKDQVLHIQFKELFEYLYKVQKIIQFLKNRKTQTISIFAAAVSDFYMPLEQMTETKMQDELCLSNTPKIIFDLHNPFLKVITFKLETDQNILEQKIFKSYQKYNSDIIIGNLLQTRYQEVYLFTKKQQKIQKITKKENLDIEYTIVKNIINLINQF